MFVRTKTYPDSSRTTVQVVQGIREGHKVKQRVVRHMGTAKNDRDLKMLMTIANEWIETYKRHEKELAGQLSFVQSPSIEESTQARIKVSETKKAGRPRKQTLEQFLAVDQISLADITEVDRVVEGVSDIGGLLFDDLGFNNVLRSEGDKALLKDLVLARITFPRSKRYLQKTLDEKFDKHYSLSKIYRLMDKLLEKIPTIQKLTFEKTRSLYPDGKIDVVLFDVTTLYFESTMDEGVRQFGFSKDHRFNTTQIVLALATNSDGLPIGYQLFPGNKAEVQTLCEAITSWQKYFDIGSVCFIGDRAMFSEANLSLLEAHGYHYVVAAKLKTLTQGLRDMILDKRNYKGRELENGETISLAEFDHKGRRLIVSYKEKRARRDAKQRDKLLDKINVKLNSSKSPTSFLNNSGVKKFTTLTGHAKVELDQSKIEADALWDGIHGVITNRSEKDALEILGYYARLWSIEDSFRVNKHNLKMRPIYHSLTRRIEVHIALCYMSFAIVRHLQYKVTQSKEENLSVHDLLDELMETQSSIYEHQTTKQRYRVPGKITHKASKIYKIFGLTRSTNPQPYLK